MYTRATSVRRAISASVFCTCWREISGLPKVSRLRHHSTREVQAALCARICLCGKADSARRRTRPRSARSRVFSPPIRLAAGHPHVGIGQLGGVRRPPAHLVQLAADLESRRALVDDDQRNTRGARAAGAGRGHHVVGAHTGGDVGLGAVDDVVVAVADRACGQVADVGAAAGFGDGRGCRSSRRASVGRT